MLLLDLCPDASVVFSMASWLGPHHLFIWLACMASSSVIPFPEQGTNQSASPGPHGPESDTTTLKRTSILDLPWPVPSAQSAPAKDNTSSTPAGNVYNLTSLHLAAPRIQCDASTYGRLLNIASCQEAWELLPTSTTRRTVGQRAEGNFDIPLPFRVLSRKYDQTQCSAIDLALVSAHHC